MCFPETLRHGTDPDCRNEIRGRPGRAGGDHCRDGKWTTPLEDSLAAHRRGVALIRHCQAQLDSAEGQVRIIEDGQAREVDRNFLERA